MGVCLRKSLQWHIDTTYNSDKSKANGAKYATRHLAHRLLFTVKYAHIKALCVRGFIRRDSIFYSLSFRFLFRGWYRRTIPPASATYSGFSYLHFHKFLYKPNSHRASTKNVAFFRLQRYFLNTNF